MAVLESLGKAIAKPFEVRHTKNDMNDLMNYLYTLNGECRIVLEHTGRYYEPVVRWLSDAGLFVSSMNPKLIKDFDNNSLRRIKTDNADSKKISLFALDKWYKLRQYTTVDKIRA